MLESPSLSDSPTLGYEEWNSHTQDPTRTPYPTTFMSCTAEWEKGLRGPVTRQ